MGTPPGGVILKFYPCCCLPVPLASFLVFSAFHHSFVCRVVAAVVCFELAVCAAVVEFYFFVLFRAAVVAFS